LHSHIFLTLLQDNQKHPPLAALTALALRAAIAPLAALFVFALLEL